LLALNTFSNS